MRMTVESSQYTNAAAPASTNSSTAAPAGLKKAETISPLKCRPSDVA